jgi:D-alanyl-D-alanine carboxypeptidase
MYLRRRLGTVLGLLIISTLMVVAVQQIRESSRIAAAWRRVGSCRAPGAGPEVVCTGVRIETITLPEQLAVCRVMIPCEAKVNAETVAAFRASLREVVARRLSPRITSFGTLNKRRCKDARTAEFIAGCISKHSYGIAVDFRSFDDNKHWDAVVAREPGVLKVIAIFERHGFVWGGTFASNFDPQHLEWRPR